MSTAYFVSFEDVRYVTLHCWPPFHRLCRAGIQIEEEAFAVQQYVRTYISSAVVVLLLLYGGGGGSGIPIVRSLQTVFVVFFLHGKKKRSGGLVV